MKKIFTISAILFATISNAQTTDFESHTLTSESFDNGSAGGGDFIFDQTHFTNFFDTQWSSWNGFAISNVTDNTTAGWANQYSAYSGSGYNSMNYAMYYTPGTISVSGGGYIEGFYITNSTYAALAMRDGDGFSKQFGSVYGPDGVTVDGTNGEDFFKVWVIGENDAMTEKDSIEFYLADYRFANSMDDYIVDTWEYIDLTQLSVSPTTVSFRFESSDMGQWGINTPTYFALDDIKYSMPLAVNEAELSSIEIYPNPASEALVIKGGEGKVFIQSSLGSIVYSSEMMNSLDVDVSQFSAGIYFVTFDNGQDRSTQKLVIE